MSDILVELRIDDSPGTCVVVEQVTFMHREHCIYVLGTNILQAVTGHDKLVMIHQACVYGGRMEQMYLHLRCKHSTDSSKPTHQACVR